mmetsp:Transcript_35461/g.63250  ORF Transcript_35461/g.63250 Transcript_35461/m.63250 type:complete len:338 (-) Transcript_35461:67-1080(-)
MVQQPHHHRLKARVAHQLHRLGDEARLHHRVAASDFKGEVVQQTDDGHEQHIVPHRHKPYQLLHRPARRHLPRILAIDAQLLKEGDRQNEELHVGAVQHLDQVHRHVLLFHLSLHAHVLRQVEQQIKRSVQQSILLLNQPQHLTLPVRQHHLPHARLHRTLRHRPRRYTFFLRAMLRPLDLEIDDVHGQRADLLLHDERMELTEVGEGEEDGENVAGEIDAALAVLAKHTRQRPQQCVMREQLLEVVCVAKQLRYLCCGRHFRIHAVFIQLLHIIVQLLDVRRLHRHRLLHRLIDHHATRPLKLSLVRRTKVVAPHFSLLFGIFGSLNRLRLQTLLP